MLDEADLQNKSSQVDAVLKSWIQDDAPGAAVVILQGDQILHNKGYGLADVKNKISVTPDTVFDLGSVSKHLTAAAALLLVERGKLPTHLTSNAGNGS